MLQGFAESYQRDRGMALVWEPSRLDLPPHEYFEQSQHARRWWPRRLHMYLPSGLTARGSQAILGPGRRADNSGLSAHGPSAETCQRTAFALIYLQNRRSTTELRPHAYLGLESPKQARMSRRLLMDNRTAHEERIISVQPSLRHMVRVPNSLSRLGCPRDDLLALRIGTAVRGGRSPRGRPQLARRTSPMRVPSSGSMNGGGGDMTGRERRYAR